MTLFIFPHSERLSKKIQSVISVKLVKNYSKIQSVIKEISEKKDSKCY